MIPTKEIHVGQVIKLLRTATGLKQKELAEKVGIKPHYLSLLESGSREPSLPVLRRIAKTLNVPVSFLFWEADGIPENVSSNDRDLWNNLRRLLLDVERIRLKENNKENE